MEYVDGINNNQSTVDVLATKRAPISAIVGMRGLNDDGSFDITAHEGRAAAAERRREEQEQQQKAEEAASPLGAELEKTIEEVAEEQERKQEAALTVEDAGRQLLEAGAYMGSVSVVNVVHDETAADGGAVDTVVAALNSTHPDTIVNEEFGLTARQVTAMRRRGINVPVTTSRGTGTQQHWIITPHPKQFTADEDRTIIDGLKAFLPLYIIADRVNCSRDFLEKHIKETPELLQVTQNRKESLKDNLEFQALRLINRGNPAMIMFGLEHQCADRGWGQDISALESTEGDRIVFGRIGEGEVVKAGKDIHAQRAVADVQMQAFLENQAAGAAAGAEAGTSAEGLAEGEMTGAGENGVPRDPLGATRAGENQLGGGYFSAEREENAEYPLGAAMEAESAGAAAEGVMDTPWDDGSGEDFSFPG